MKVEIAFDLSANGVGDYFTLNDAVKGKLNSVTYKLAGEVLVDVTDVTREVSVNRGRSRTLERFTAGIASITLDNRNRAFDPLYTASPYFGSITPRRQVRISHLDQVLFTGNIEEWSWGYSLEGDATATVQAVDGLSVLSNVTLSAGTATAELSGARVSKVLTDAGWTSTQRVISSGAATIDGDTIAENVNAMDYLSKVANISEAGAFFIDKNGAAAFRDRTDLQKFADRGVVFGGTGIPFYEFQSSAQTQELKNRASVSWYGGTAVAGTATATDTASQATFGVFDVQVDTLLSNQSQAQYLADWLVGKYGTPGYWVDQVGVHLHALSGTQMSTVLGIELADPVKVQFSPPGGGTAISQYLVVDKIEHSANPGAHDMRFTLSPGQVSFVLDSVAFGRLNTDLLGF